jgi:hypothetical protein
MQTYTVFTKSTVIEIIADRAEMDDDDLLTFRMNDGEVVGVFPYPEGFALSVHLGGVSDIG